MSQRNFEKLNDKGSQLIAEVTGLPTLQIRNGDTRMEQISGT